MRGAGVQKLVVDRDVHTTVSYATHVAHIGGRLVILVVLMPDPERDGAAAGPDPPPAPLTPRELEVIRRIALGATQWRSMTSTATGGRDARVGTFVWTPSTGVLRSCASLPSLLDLDADDDRPLLTRIVAQLHRDDIDRLHAP